MASSSFQIRICPACGLRYPLVEDNRFGTRCPACLGSTEVAATHPLRTENRIPLKAASTQLAAILDNIRSAWNVGSIFRTADGFGLRHLHLCGITPTPEVDALKKTALSAEHTIAWTYHKNALAAAQELKAGGCRLLALEEHPRAISIFDVEFGKSNTARNADFSPPIAEREKRTKVRAPGKTQSGKERLVLIVGNEVTGVDPEILELCDEILYIPMRGGKKSFNVSVAFAVAVSQLIVRIEPTYQNAK